LEITEVKETKTQKPQKCRR